jgi:D-amino-acid dehydrogenase
MLDEEAHAVIVPIGRAVRIAGTAEFAGFDRTLRPERIEPLVGLARKLFPEARVDVERMSPWCGLRPVSCDGVPIIGRTTVPNLLVNTGHGHLGWTMAAGSAQLLTDLLSGDSPGIDAAPYSPDRFLH